MPTEAQIRQTVKDIILLQEAIYFNGGTCQSSRQYRWLLLKIRRLVQAIGLPYSPENVKALFNYPLTTVVDIHDPCSVTLCPHMPKKMLEGFVDAVNCGMIRFSSSELILPDIEYKVDEVIGNVVGLTGRVLGEY